MKVDNTQLIAAIDAKEAAEKHDNLTGRLRAAMNAVRGHWCCTDEGKQFLAAVAAVIDLSPFEEKARIRHEMDVLERLAGGGALDMDLLTKPYEPIGILKMWREG